MLDFAKDNAASTPRTIYLKDYQIPAYLVEDIALRIELHPATTQVTSRLVVKRNPDLQLSDHQQKFPFLPI